MRVLVVHDHCGDFGGAEGNVRLAANGLAARGAQIALLHGDETAIGAERFRTAFGACFAWQGRESAALAEALAWGPDVIYAHKVADQHVLAGLVASGVPLVRMVHDHDLYCQRSYRYFPWNRRICTRRAGYACALTCGVLRGRGALPLRLAWPGKTLAGLALSRQCVRALVISGFMRDELLLHGFAPEQVVVVPLGFRPASDDALSQYTEPLALYVGQVIRGKGVDALIDALARIHDVDWRLAVVGDGSHRAFCERLAVRLGVADRVQFLGHVAQETLGPLYRRARVAVVPSLWPEPGSMVGPEAMHRGLPVVAFAVGGIPEWLADGVSGTMVPWNDRVAFASATAHFLRDPQAAAHAGRAGLAVARQRFLVDDYLDRIHDLLAAAAAGRGLAAPTPGTA